MSQRNSKSVAAVSTHASRTTGGPPFGSDIKGRVMDIVVDRLMEELAVAERALRKFQSQLHRRDEGASPCSCAMTAHPEVVVTDCARKWRCGGSRAAA